MVRQRDANGQGLMRWMHLRFHAPLAAFGGEMIDAHGVIRNVPAQSMLTGLLANALGWTRAMRADHQALQDRIVFGAVWERDVTLSRMTDYQTAQLGKNDRAWTTRGVPAGRAGGAATYMGAHQRWRDYHADLRLAVVLRLDPADAVPTMEALAAALDRPARPLFIGRKSCLPSAPIFGGWVMDAPNACAALRAVAPADAGGLLAFWPETEGAAGAYRTTTVTDERNWVSGLHGGGRRICEGSLSTSRDEA